jgi:hypothetical protein
MHITSAARFALTPMERERSVVASRLLPRMSLDDLRALRQGLVALATAAGTSTPARSRIHRSPKEL